MRRGSLPCCTKNLIFVVALPRFERRVFFSCHPCKRAENARERRDTRRVRADILDSRLGGDGSDGLWIVGGDDVSDDVGCIGVVSRVTRNLDDQIGRHRGDMSF